jgi:hypothetical protein
MASSRTKQIGRIQPGDKVLSLDETTGKLIVARVIRRLDQKAAATVVLRLTGGETIETTLRNRFMLASGQYVPASRLSAGERLKTHDNQLVEIVRISRKTEATVVHHLELDKAMNYHVGKGGILTSIIKEDSVEEPASDSQEAPKETSRRSRPGRPAIGPKPRRKR